MTEGMRWGDQPSGLSGTEEVSCDSGLSFKTETVLGKLGQLVTLTEALILLFLSLFTCWHPGLSHQQTSVCSGYSPVQTDGGKVRGKGTASRG